VGIVRPGAGYVDAWLIARRARGALGRGRPDEVSIGVEDGTSGTVRRGYAGVIWDGGRRTVVDGEGVDDTSPAEPPVPKERG
jgi:hypothetical protein